MAVMQWIGAFFSLNWLDALAVICSITAVGAGIVFLWRRVTGAAAPSELHVESAEGRPTFRQRRVA